MNRSCGWKYTSTNTTVMARPTVTAAAASRQWVAADRARDAMYFGPRGGAPRYTPGNVAYGDREYSSTTGDNGSWASARCEVDSGHPAGISTGGFPQSPPEPGVPVIPAPGSPLVPLGLP